MRGILIVKIDEPLPLPHMQESKRLRSFIAWRLRYISRRNFIFIISVLVGLISGFAAVTLRSSVLFIERIFTGDSEFGNHTFLYFLFPLIGMLLVVFFIKRFLKERLGRGLSNILYAINQKSGLIDSVKTYSHMVTAAFTVGFGGSVGLEAPIVTTGSAIGSNLARIFHLDRKARMLLIGCGAAGATAAIFNSPITGVVFALEILLLELSVPSFIPLLLSAISGVLVSKLFLGNNTLFAPDDIDPFYIYHLPLYILLGIIAGLFSVYFTRVTNSIENRFSKINSLGKRALIGGGALGVLLVLMPPLYGEGYNTLKIILADRPDRIINETFFGAYGDQMVVVVSFFVVLLFTKVLAAALTTGGGGNGGIFAPSIFTGGLLGYSFAKVNNLINPYNPISELNFGLVGAAGIVSGVMHAPLTGIFLIVETTTSYDLIVPLMTVSAIAYATIKYFEPHSIFASQLARRGQLLTHDKDKEVLVSMDIRHVIEDDFKTVFIEASLGKLVEIVADSKRNIFPVLDDHDQLMGIITLDDIRPIMFKAEEYNTIKVQQIMHPPPTIVDYKESMESVMRKFEQTGAWNLPVTDNGKYVGFLSKSKIFNAYRKLLIDRTRHED